MDTLNDGVNKYVIESPLSNKAICAVCGNGGLTITQNIYEWDYSPIACPVQGWPTGNCSLQHWKVYNGERCTYCEYEIEAFWMDKVKCTHTEDYMEATYWVKDSTTHNLGYSVHQCPCTTLCTNAYYYLDDLISLP